MRTSEYEVEDRSDAVEDFGQAYVSQVWPAWISLKEYWVRDCSRGGNETKEDSSDKIHVNDSKLLFQVFQTPHLSPRSEGNKMIRKHARYAAANARRVVPRYKSARCAEPTKTDKC
jgi:hypothetical protein